MSDEKENKLFDDVFSNIRKAAEANLHLQNEMFRQLTTMWPGFSTPQSMWVDRVRDFQKQWSTTVTEIARKHRESVDRQYKSALESMEEALRVAESRTPDDLRRRTEHLCRKTVDCLKDVSETQMKEFQEAIARWTDLLTKSAT